MDKIENYRENRITDLIREIVNAEINKRIGELQSTMTAMCITRSDLETFMETDGFNYLSDDLDDAIGDYLRNQVTVEINC